MDVEVFSNIINDKNFINYKKMQYKYKDDFKDFLSTIKKSYYREIPLFSFKKSHIVYIPAICNININNIKMMMNNPGNKYGIKAAEDEIISSSAIENIDFQRNSVRKILRGFSPEDKEEERIYGIKKGLDFISDTTNKINEENLYKLYMMTVGEFLDEESKLKEGNFYRHDSVYIKSDHIEHEGISYKMVSSYMKDLLEFINSDDNINDLVKASMIHFYISYIHPYFDGNGRTARFLHLWFLIQRGYKSTLFIPFSYLINETKSKYYDAFTKIEENKKISNVIDVTPFILYFIDNVYNKIKDKMQSEDVFMSYNNVLEKGIITEKEKELWEFVLSFYGTNEFSTKKLEKDFNNVAYATVRSFVLKFEKLGFLSSVTYKNKKLYKIKER